MAAPHLDNPYGAKGGKGGKENDTSGKGKGEKSKGNKVDVGQSEGDSDLPTCAHPFCNEPSDPTNFPVGLPWASGRLKCLPGFCAKHRNESISEMMNAEGEEVELDEFIKSENVCKCKDPPPLACPHKQNDLKNLVKSQECGKPYPKFIYPDDPCVNQELSFFLRMMMVADELDRWQEEDQKKEREEARKRREKKKAKGKDKGKGKEDRAETGSTEQNKKSKAGRKRPQNRKAKEPDQ